jgi:hypothetical protein
VAATFKGSGHACAHYPAEEVLVVSKLLPPIAGHLACRLGSNLWFARQLSTVTILIIITKVIRKEGEESVIETGRALGHFPHVLRHNSLHVVFAAAAVRTQLVGGRTPFPPFS